MEMAPPLAPLRQRRTMMQVQRLTAEPKEATADLGQAWAFMAAMALLALPRRQARREAERTQRTPMSISPLPNMVEAVEMG